ncbi:MAG: hypothetical protein ABIR47_08195 [Candidatus Kapaibacterium sp.]
MMMNDMMHSIQRLRRMAGAFALLALVATAPALAQGLATDAPPAADDIFSFGPPLRSKMVFAYKYTERVKVLSEMNGQRYDSSERNLIYFITERQIPGDKKGLIKVEANIDSMRIEIRGQESKLVFDTQKFVGGDPKVVRNREIFIPSVLVNNLVTFTITSYGQILKVESKGLQNSLAQASDPAVDEFTRERLRASITDEYLTSIFLPWRGLAPLGQKVQFGKTLTVPSSAVLDRVSFRDTAAVRLLKSPEGDAHLNFSAKLNKSSTKLMTMVAFDDPVKVTSASGTLSGDLTLDQDGVVRSGWAKTSGTVDGNRSGAKIRSAIDHEIYFEMMGLAPFNAE